MENRMQQNIRCFVAIEIPEVVQNRLIAIQDELRRKIGRASWVKAGNIHLTLKFLGEVDPSDIQPIGEVLERVAQRHPPFSMRIGGIGAFPNLARPRVLWVGVTVGAAEVKAFAQELNAELSGCGYPSDNKRSNPHLTLARLKSGVNLNPLVDIFRQYDQMDGPDMVVDGIALIQSQLHPSGAIYTPLRFCALNKEMN
jgi:2'-5' RNA ligase